MSDRETQRELIHALLGNEDSNEEILNKAALIKLDEKKLAFNDKVGASMDRAVENFVEKKSIKTGDPALDAAIQRGRKKHIKSYERMLY